MRIFIGPKKRAKEPFYTHIPDITDVYAAILNEKVTDIVVAMVVPGFREFLKNLTSDIAKGLINPPFIWWDGIKCGSAFVIFKRHFFEEAENVSSHRDLGKTGHLLYNDKALYTEYTVDGVTKKIPLKCKNIFKTYYIGTIDRMGRSKHTLNFSPVSGKEASYGIERTSDMIFPSVSEVPIMSLQNIHTLIWTLGWKYQIWHIDPKSPTILRSGQAWVFPGEKYVMQCGMSLIDPEASVRLSEVGKDLIFLNIEDAKYGMYRSLFKKIKSLNKELIDTKHKLLQFHRVTKD